MGAQQVTLEKPHSAAHSAAQQAAELVVSEVQKVVAIKEEEKRNSESEGPEPEPPLDSEAAATPCPAPAPPLAAPPAPAPPTSVRANSRPTPSPLQDDPSWSGYKEMELQHIEPRAQAKAISIQVLQSPQPSPEAQHPPLWPQTPQSPMPLTTPAAAAAAAAASAYDYSYGSYGSYGYSPYSSYGYGAQGYAGWDAPASGADMRGYYPQEAWPPMASQLQWSQGNNSGNFFQPFSTQPTVPAPVAMQPVPMRAPLTAQYNTPLLNTQPVHPYQVPIQRTQPPQQPQPPPPQPQPVPPQPPAAAQPQPQPRQKPSSPTHSKQERRQAAEEVLARQQAWVAALQRTSDVGESKEREAGSAVSTAVTTPAAVSVEKPKANSIHTEERARCWADEAEDKPDSKAPPTPASTTTPAPATPSEDAYVKTKKEKEAGWTPRIAPSRRPRSPGSGKGASDFSHSTPDRSVGKVWQVKGKGKGTLVYRPKQPQEEKEVEELAMRRPRRRGKVSEYNTETPAETQAAVERYPRGRRRGKFSHD